MSNPGPELKRSLTLPMCVSLCIGAIIGAGIFTTTGTGISMVGTALPMVFILASLFVAFTNLPSIYQAGALPATGGAYMYVSRLVPAGNPQTVVLIGSIGIIILLAVAHTFGAKLSGQVQNIIVVLMLIALGVYIIPGMAKVDPQYVTFRQAFWPATVDLGKTWAALALIRYSLQGGGVIFSMGDEVKNPRKTIPTAFFIGTFAVGVIYALIGYVTVGVLPIEAVAGQPLSVAAEAILGDGLLFQFFMVGGALLAIVTTLNGSFMIYSRTHFAAARDGIWPSALEKTNKYKSPYAAVWICAAVGILGVLFFRNELSNLLMFVSVPGLLMAFIYYIPPVMVKRRLPNCAARAWFKIPYPVLVAICIISSVLTFYLGMSLFSRLQPIHWIGMISVYAIGAVYYYFRYNWLKKNKNIDLIANMKGMHPYWLEIENNLDRSAEGGASE